jgi:hypothetical protein
MPMRHIEKVLCLLLTKLVMSSDVADFRQPVALGTSECPGRRGLGCTGWSVRESTVGSRERITALADGDDLVNLGAHRVRHTARTLVVHAARGVGAEHQAERLVDPTCTQPAVVFLGQDAGPDLIASMTVGSTGVAHRPSTSRLNSSKLASISGSNRRRSRRPSPHPGQRIRSAMSLRVRASTTSSTVSTGVSSVIRMSSGLVAVIGQPS